MGDSDRFVTVKNLKGNEKMFSFSNKLNYDEFHEMVHKGMNIEDDKIIKFMNQGKIIDENNFSFLSNGSTLLYLVQKKVKPVMLEQKKEQVKEQENEKSVILEDVDKEDIDKEDSKSFSYNKSIDDDTVPQYTFEEVRASMIVLLNFVRDNPQVRNLFETDYGAFVNEMLTNPALINITKNIVSQSSQILHAIKTGGNISVNINGDSGTVNKIELTKEEEDTIKNIIDMGFDATKVIKTFIECGKDAIRTIDALTR